jgi:CRP/FNR family transcriptional regulator
MTCICEQLAGQEVSLAEVCLGQLWMFERLTPEELGALMAAVLRKVYEKGEAIFRQGDPADRMFLIKGGRVKLSKVDEEGIETTLDIRKAGDILGETQFNEEEAGAYPLTAWCMEKTLICGLTQARFEKLVLAYPNIGLQVIRNLSRRVGWLTSRVGSMSATNLEERLYRVLVNVAQEHGEPGPRGVIIHFPLTHEELGFLVGAHRVSITRALKDLRDTGRIIQEGRFLVLPETPQPTPAHL